MSALSGCAQGTTAVPPPRFEDYPVSGIFAGKPAAPIPATAEQRLYRTRIREGVALGMGVGRDGIDQPGPNFAGQPAVEFRRTSRLMIMKPRPILSRGPVYTHYFIWQDDRWSLIRRIPLEPESIHP